MTPVDGRCCRTSSHSLPTLTLLASIVCTVIVSLSNTPLTLTFSPINTFTFNVYADKQASKSDEEKAKAEAQFKAVNEAYEVLSCSEKKAR